MAASRTGAERYLAQRLRDPDYKNFYDQAKERTAQIDIIIGSLESRRTELNLTKAELARRAGVQPEAVRRLFSAKRPNPTLNTLIAIAGALDLEFRPEPTRGGAFASGVRSSAARTPRDTA